MKYKDNHINMMIKVIKDCQEHKHMGTPNIVWSKYFRYALNVLEKDLILESTSVRNNPDQKIIHEHTFPFSILRDKLMGLKDVNSDSILNILYKFHVVTKITKEEDIKLKDKGLDRSMPKDWDGENPYARYESAGISIYKETDNS